MWVLKWQVRSHSSDRMYTVAVDEHGQWGCDCPQGKYRRDRGPCKHVREVQAGPAKGTRLPAQETAPMVGTPPPVTAAEPVRGRRLPNVSVVFAELQGKGTSPTEPAQAPSAVRDLLSALDE
ncbi:MAG: hypothetical protein U0166_29215 [Acidobacteriota bacterium]